MCQCLLKAMTVENAPFLVRGSHSAITACTLPEWLPDSYVKYMNRVFGGQLRRELTEILSYPQVRQNGTQSIGSQRLSLDSLQQGSRIELHENRTADMKLITRLK